VSRRSHTSLLPLLASPSPDAPHLVFELISPVALSHSTTLPHTDDRYTNPDGAITGLAFSPISNLLAFTAYNGSFSRWTDPIPKTHPSPTVSDAIQAKTLDKLLDDEFGDEDGLDIEERGEDIDDWIVDDDGYAEEEGKGRREVVSSTKAQPAFGPGSTGMRNKKRYLGMSPFLLLDIRTIWANAA
jgi:chromosome transmission fidelity protein 4